MLVLLPVPSHVNEAKAKSQGIILKGELSVYC